MSGGGELHGGAWAAWIGAVLAVVTATRNPLYLGLALLWVAAVGWTVRPAAGEENTLPAAPLSPARFAAVVIVLAALFNGLTVHVGQNVLFRLPDGWPLVGGAVTLEALAYGALNGAALSIIFAAFYVVNRLLPMRAIVRMIPRAFHPMAVAAAIALTFVPVTLRQFRTIREAQAVRGHQVRGVRSWLPLLAPLLISGLERALQLSEAMVARGFAGGEGQATPFAERATLAAGLALFVAGWLLRLVWGAPLFGLTLMAAGLAAGAAAVWRLGRAHPYTVHRPQPWTQADWGILAGAAMTTAAFLLPLPGMERTSLFYYPYPALSLPGFSALLGAATWGLLAPAAAALVQRP